MIKLIYKLFGGFWTMVWHDIEQLKVLVDSLEYFLGYLLKPLLDNLYKSTSLAFKQTVQAELPTKIWLIKSTQRKAYIGVTSVTPGNLQPDTATTANWYTIQCTNTQLQDIQMLQNKLNKTQFTLIEDLDFKFQGGRLYTRVSAGDLHLDTEIKLNVNGQPIQYYVIWGYTNKPVTLRNVYPAALTMSTDQLSSTQALRAAWKVQQLGTTIYNIKYLIGKLIDCPVAQYNQTVLAITTQQGMHCVYTDKTVYSCQLPAVVTVNQELNVGDRLFSYDFILSGKDILPSSSILPAISVNTTIGVCTAVNQSVSAGSGILPLSGTNQALYQQAVTAAMDNPNIPIIAIPSTVNPAQFVLQKLQRSSGILLLLPNTVLQSVRSYVIDIITKLLGRSTILTVVEQSEASGAFDLTIRPSGTIIGYINN